MRTRKQRISDAEKNLWRAEDRDAEIVKTAMNWKVGEEPWNFRNNRERLIWLATISLDYEDRFDMRTTVITGWRNEAKTSWETAPTDWRSVEPAREAPWE